MSRSLVRLSLVAAWLCVAAPAAAQVTVTQRIPCDPSVACHELRADIRTPRGKAALFLRFEKVTGLSTHSFRITAQQVDHDALAGRLPAGTFVNPRLPLLFTIERAPSSATTFRGQWSLEIRTDAIDFDGEAPTARLFQARAGGAFSDITQSMGFGSYRVHGASGDFSEFLLVTDLRPPRRIAVTKFQDLADEIDAGSSAGKILPATYAQLSDRLKRSREAFDAGQVRLAVSLLEELVDIVVEQSGVTVFDTWDPGTGKVSNAGLVRGKAEALRLSIELALRQRSAASASLVRRLTTPAGRQLELILSFPQEVGDLTGALSITAVDVDPQDPALLARLPVGVAIPRSFPVLVHVTPVEGARPSFRGPWEVELRTRDLEFTERTPLRLFKAPDGGPFADVTDALGVGSYRVHGATGDFSELMVLVDRRSPEDVTAQKLEALEELLAALAPQIADSLEPQLADLLAETRAHVSGEAFRLAIAALEDFVALVADRSGTEVSDLFRHGDSRVNAAGRLIGAARSLQLSLTLRRNARVIVAP